MRPGRSLIDQYLEIKNQDKSAILLFQVGGFYQMYYHDADLASREMGTRLISRAVGGGKRAPMCGVPVASGEAYAEKLAAKGYRVTLCRQSEERDDAGMAVREVFRVVEAQGEPHDLTGEWEDYFNNNSFEDLRPSRPKATGKKCAGAGSSECDLLRQLRGLRLEDITPMEAMRLLYDWKRSFAGEPTATD